MALGGVLPDIIIGCEMLRPSGPTLTLGGRWFRMMALVKCDVGGVASNDEFGGFEFWRILSEK